MKQLFTFVFLAVFLVACNEIKDFEYRDIRNIKLNAVGFSKSSISFELVYYNPNQFSIDLKNINSEVLVDHSPMGKFNLDTLMRIKANSEFMIPATIEVDMKNLVKKSAGLLFNKEVLLEAVGSVKVGKAGFYKTLPYKYEGKQALNLF